METETRPNAETRERGEILSPDELAELLKCKRTFVYSILSQGLIPSFKLGKLRRVRRADVDRYIEKQLTATK
jgi:excisionase family DNA binding protein